MSYLKLLTIALAGAALVMPAAAAAAPGRPALVSPAADANVQGVPAFTWNRVKRADRYEFQLAADPSFGSIVSKGSFQTRNTAASILTSLADGEYFWRVRAINAKGDAGRWASRSLSKGWSARPDLLAPADAAQVAFPGTPLVLRWTAVPRAYKYRVYIATDPGLGTLAVSDRGGPITTSGTVYSPGVNLAPGRYYWAVEPVDASSHRGSRSAVGSFDWSWPSATSTAVSDLIDEPVVMDPHLAWNPVPGAVGYEVEVNYSDDWSVGSKVCCNAATPGTELSPDKILPNNVYNWRVRALDPDGNAGQWNVGGPFDKHFGNVPPTVSGLDLRDHNGGLPIGATTSTSSPAVIWDPVPGAADYEVQVAPFSLGLCQWTATGSHVWRDAITAATAWTPLAPGNATPPDTNYSDVGIAHDGGRTLVDGTPYCFRVRARTGDPAVVSDWTQLGGTGAVGFTYDAPAAQVGTPGTMLPEKYGLPAHGSSTPRIPLFTWQPISGANSYWVVVAKDAAFTQIFDVAVTQATVYAPRVGNSPETYPDDTTPYYWAVLPASGTTGACGCTTPSANSPRSFVKSSAAPAPLLPAEGADVSGQPVFRWGWREGAKEYRLQVAQDPTFGNVIDDVKTQATSFTPTDAYPADTVLYWRVRVTDVKNRGLTWSPTGTFRRRLPIPVHGDNPTGGPTIPALAWNPVQGAESYSIHADQSDGTKRDFTLRGTVFTPVIFYGTGVWRWQVRANFPGGSHSGWSSATPFTRTIPPPDGVNAINKDGRVLISWEPSVMAKKYRVDVSTTNSFSTVAYSATTENLANAPTFTDGAFVDGGTLYWRVAAVDEGNNVGGFATGQFKTPKRMVVRVSGAVSRTAKSRVTVTATDARGRAVKRAKVRISGAAHAKSKRTGRKGTANFMLRARRAGTVTFRVVRSGYRAGVAKVVVR